MKKIVMNKLNINKLNRMTNVFLMKQTSKF